MSFAWVCRFGVWFGIVGSALLLAVGTCVVLSFEAMPGLCCFLRVTSPGICMRPIKDTSAYTGEGTWRRMVQLQTPRAPHGATPDWRRQVARESNSYAMVAGLLCMVRMRYGISCRRYEGSWRLCTSLSMVRESLLTSRHARMSCIVSRARSR